MVNYFPFVNFAIRLSNLRTPTSINTWISFFEEDFNNVKFIPKGQADLQFSLCDVYKIDFDAPVVMNGVDKFSTLPFSSTLFNSNGLFYLLLQIGQEHHYASAASSAMKRAPELFRQYGGGRFLSIQYETYISFEEDELDKYYILATSNKSMMEMDELFNFARGVLS